MRILKIIIINNNNHILKVIRHYQVKEVRGVLILMEMERKGIVRLVMKS